MENRYESFLDDNLESILDDISVTNGLREPLLSSLSSSLFETYDVNTITMMDNDSNDNDVTHPELTIIPRERLSWYNSIQENKIQIVAMLSNYSTSYNVVNISLVLPILKEIIATLHHNNNNNPSELNNDGLDSVLHSSIPTNKEEYSAIVASSLLAGMMIGQILGGALGDAHSIGRLGALKIVIIIQIIASLASSLLVSLPVAVDGNASGKGIYIQLAIWRLFLGIGAGGVYPLAAVLSAEQNTNTNTNNETNYIIPNDNNNHSELEDDGYENNRNEVDTKANPPIEELVDTQYEDYTVQNDELPNNNNNDNISEASNHSNDSVHRVVLTFSTQGAGFVTVPILAVSLLHLVPHNLNFVWRTILGFGAIPGFVILLLLATTTTTPSTNKHTFYQQQQNPSDSTSNNNTDDPQQRRHRRRRRQRELVPTDDPDDRHTTIDNDEEMEDVEDSTNDAIQHATYNNNTSIINNSDVTWWQSIHKEERLIQKLIGTAVTWFLFDVLFYGNTLFQPVVIQAAFGSNDTNHPTDGIHVLQQTALDTLYLSLIALPGYLVAGLVMHGGGTNKHHSKQSSFISFIMHQSPKYVMLQGFFFMSVLYMIIGIGWDTIRRNSVALVTLYGLTFFFANYGPNTSTFILPSLVFEQPESRSTLNGICAACGKLGALIGATLFAPASQQFGDSIVMILCSIIAITSFLITLWFVPDVSNSNNQQHQHATEQGTNIDTPISSEEEDEGRTDSTEHDVAQNNYHFDDHQII